VTKGRKATGHQLAAGLPKNRDRYILSVIKDKPIFGLKMGFLFSQNKPEKNRSKERKKLNTDCVISARIVLKGKRMNEFKVGISSCNQNDSFAAGQILARDSLVNGDIEKPTIGLAFCAGRHNHNRFFQGLRSVLPSNVPIIGGSCIGVITNDDLCYSSIADDENYPAALAVLQLPDTIDCRLVSVGNLDKDEEKAGREFSNKCQIGPDDKAVFLIYDSIKVPLSEEQPPVLNSAAHMLAGITNSTFNFQVPLIGGGVIGDYGFNSTQQFCGFSIEKQSIVAAIYSGAIEPHFCITHGCSLLSGTYYKITKAEGACIYELDNQPIVELIDNLFGGKEWQKQNPLKTLTIGMNESDKFSDFEEDNYKNRLIVGPTADKKGIVLFDADIKEGDEIQLMLRNGPEMIESAREKSKQLIAEIRSKGKKPVFAIYIDCAGRSAFFSGTDREEAAEIQKILNENNIPLLGFYSGVEIAPIAHKIKGLDWTGVLMILTD